VARTKEEGKTRKEEHIMRKTERKLLERLWKPERKVEKPRVDSYGMFQSKTPQRNVGANATSRS